MPVSVPVSPLSPAYARVAEVLPAFRFTEEEPRSGPGWVSGSELAAGGPAAEAFLRLGDEQIRRDYGRPARPHVVASLGLHHYAWPAGVLFTLPYFLLRRVPRLRPADVSFHRERRWLTVRGTAFDCLPDDPAASHPLARVVAGEEALREAVRTAAADHLGPILAAFAPLTRRGRRALWGMAADELTEGLWYLGRLLGEEERAAAEAELLLPGPAAPYPTGAAFRRLTGHRGEQLMTRDRASCCLAYTLRAQEPCATCPRLRDTERVKRLEQLSVSRQ